MGLYPTHELDIEALLKHQWIKDEESDRAGKYRKYTATAVPFVMELTATWDGITGKWHNQFLRIMDMTNKPVVSYGPIVASKLWKPVVEQEENRRKQYIKDRQRLWTQRFLKGEHNVD